MFDRRGTEKDKEIEGEEEKGWRGERMERRGEAPGSPAMKIVNRVGWYL